VIIAEYPVDVVPTPSNSLNEGAYWSAYVDIGPDDIKSLWKVNRLDYLLVTAEVTMPTFDNKLLVRTIPLYTIENGHAEAQGGVDLLEKMPLYTGARKQITFQLKISFLRNKKALDAAKKILATVAKLAKPFLGNYPVASNIYDEAIPLLDTFVERSKTPVSAKTITVHPEELYRKANTSEEGSVMKAFFLLPDKHPRSDRAPKQHCAKRRVLEKLGNLQEQGGKYKVYKNPILTECGNLLGKLCLQGDPKVGATVTSKIECLETEKAESGRTNATLRSPREIQDATGLSSEAAKIKVERLTTCTPKQLFPNYYKDKGDHSFLDLEAEKICAHWTKWKEIADPTERGNQAEALRKAIESSYGTLADRLIKEQKNKADSKFAQLDSLVYITIKFKQFKDVYDPLLVFSTPGGDCNSVTPGRVSTVETYINTNKSLFLPRDIESARRVLVEASRYLELQKLGPAELLSRLAHASNQDFSEMKSPFKESLEKLNVCRTNLLGISPQRELKKLVDVYKRQDSKAPKSQRINEIVAALRDVAAVINDTPLDFSGAVATDLSSKLAQSSIYQGLLQELRALRLSELNNACDETQSEFSASCTTCKKKSSSCTQAKR